MSLDEVADAIQNGIWAGLPEYPLAITLDDGHRGNRELTETFRRYGVRPTVFACSAVVNGDGRYWFRELDRPTRERLKRMPHRERAAATAALPPGPRHALTPEELREMASVFDIGSHSRTHPVLTTCTPSESGEEIAGSKEEIEAITGRPCRHFCFPNGDHLPLTETLVARAGYDSARTMDFGWNSKRTSPYRLRVLAAEDRISVTRMCADLGGASIVAGWIKGRRAGSKRPIVVREEGMRNFGAPRTFP